MCVYLRHVFLLFLIVIIPSQCLSAEISLFNFQGQAVAYIDTEDEITIYLWGGEPVAYYDKGNIYGFNGKHLGWFENGVLYGRDGYVSCVVKNAFPGPTQYEGFKAFKNFKPFRAFQEFAPFKPFLSNQFGSNECESYLRQGT